MPHDHPHAESILKALEVWSQAEFDAAVQIPSALYTSEEIAALEIDRIFCREWICVGREDDLPAPESYFATDVAQRPVLVVRDGAGAFRAFSNICPHRGMTICEGRGSARSFSCPYHAWTYDLDGRLIGAPFMDDSPNFQPERVCLREYRIESWHGFLYVNLDPDAEPLAPRLEGADSTFSKWRVAEMKPVFRTESIYACNWKVLCENFCESYHLFRVHPKTLEPYTPTKGVRVHPGGAGYNLHSMDSVQTREDMETDGANLSHLSDDDLRLAPLYCLYPSHALAIHGGSVTWVSLQPLGADRVMARAGVDRLADHTGGVVDFALASSIRDDFDAFMAEDKLRIEAIQQNLAFFEPTQPYCQMERTNWEFGQYLRRRLCTTA